MDIEELRALSDKATPGEWSIRTIGLRLYDEQFAIECVNRVRAELTKDIGLCGAQADSMNSAAAWQSDGGDMGRPTEAKLGAPTSQTLAELLSQKRMAMLSELRDLEQALEALEKQPEFEPTMNRVMKILQRRY